MRTTNRLLLAGALLAAAPAPALVAQTGQPGPGQHHPGPGGPGGPGQRGPAMNPVAMLLEHRDDLKLTPDQVTRLTAIQRDLDTRNAPLVAQLDSLRPRGPRDGQPPAAPPTDAERQAMRQRFEQARPTMERLRENTRAAMDRVRDVLNEEQRQAAARFLPPPRGPRGPGGPEGGPGGERP